MKRVTKILALALCVAMLAGIFAACNNDDDTIVLRVYNWEDYLSPEVVKNFEDYMLAEHNQKVRVEENFFDTNETMFTKIEKGKEKYDLVCPSDYMIEKMIKAGLCAELDMNLLTNYDENVPAFIKEHFGDFADINGKTYAAGYMWGTLGILYNKTKLAENGDADIIKSWGSLWNENYKNEIFMKDSIRDSIAAVAFYLAGKDAARTPEQYKAILNDFSDKNIEAVGKALEDQKNKVKTIYEVDEAKNRMAEPGRDGKGKYAMALMWSGDAMSAILDGANNNVQLGYEIPEEGSNLFFDGWVIPKDSENYELAHQFIDFLSTPESAKLNMEEIGYTSVVGGQEIFDWAVEENKDLAIPFSTDVSYFFDNIDGAETANINPVRYASWDELQRCAVMQDFGEKTGAWDDMWVKAKGDSIAWWWWAAIAVVGAGGLIAFMVLRKKKD